jgi:hypothetical protein
MKLTIELTDAEVKGIKAYLKEVEDNNIPVKADIQEYLQNIVGGILHSPQESVSSFIQD